MGRRIRLPKHLQALNPELGEEVNLPPERRPVGATEDKRGEFGYWWRTLVLREPDYFPLSWAPAEGVKFASWEFDWAFPELHVAVEVDGGQHSPGGGRHARDSDRWKLNEAAAQGWLVLRFSPEMLAADPRRCVDYVKGALIKADEPKPYEW